MAEGISIPDVPGQLVPRKCLGSALWENPRAESCPLQAPEKQGFDDPSVKVKVRRLRLLTAPCEKVLTKITFANVIGKVRVISALCSM